MARAADEPVEGRGGTRRGGRPRSSGTQQAILDATRELLAEGGVRGLTIEGVAARAGVAKTTIYRRWRSKHELALAVLLDMVERMGAVPDMGEAREEMVAAVAGAVRVLGSTLTGRVMQGLVSDLAADPALAEAFRSGAVALRQAEVRRIVERGIGRGELRPGTDPELVHELLFGPVYYRLMLSGRPLDPGLPERVVAPVLAAFALAEPRSPALGTDSVGSPSTARDGVPRSSPADRSGMEKPDGACGS
jgi:AcrR family transcriptional regulator